MTDAGKKFGVKRQSMQVHMDYLKRYLPGLTVDTIGRRGREGDVTRSKEHSRLNRLVGTALKLPHCARTHKFMHPKAHAYLALHGR